MQIKLWKREWVLCVDNQGQNQCTEWQENVATPTYVGHTLGEEHVIAALRSKFVFTQRNRELFVIRAEESQMGSQYSKRNASDSLKLVRNNFIKQTGWKLSFIYDQITEYVRYKSIFFSVKTMFYSVKHTTIIL
jgi:hypothetical protein